VVLFREGIKIKFKESPFPLHQTY